MNRLILPFYYLVLFCCLTSPLTAQETGIAEVYPSTFNGKTTSSGSAYNPQALTGAHKMHGIGTMLKVTRTDENARRFVIVKINDRGPYTAGHIVTLSKAAALRLGMTENATATVVVEVISPAYSNSAEKERTPTPTVQKVKVNTAPPTTGSGTVTPKTYSPAPTGEQFTAKSGQTPQAATTKPPLIRQGFNTFGLYKIALQQPKRQGFGVQVMSLSRPEKLLEQVALLQQKWFDNVLVSIEPGGGFNGNEPVYKVILGPFNTEQQARTYASNLKQKFKMEGFVVSLAEVPK